MQSTTAVTQTLTKRWTAKQTNTLQIVPCMLVLVPFPFYYGISWETLDFRASGPGGIQGVLVAPAGG